MNQPSAAWTDQRVETIVASLLRAGVCWPRRWSALGGVIFLVRHGRAMPQYARFVGEPFELRTVSGIMRGSRFVSRPQHHSTWFAALDCHSHSPRGFLGRRPLRWSATGCTWSLRSSSSPSCSSALPADMCDRLLAKLEFAEELLKR